MFLKNKFIRNTNYSDHEFIEHMKDLTKPIDIKLKNIPKVSDETLKNGEALEYIMDRVKFMLDCIETGGGVITVQKNTDQMRVTIGAKDEVFKNIPSIIYVKGCKIPVRRSENYLFFCEGSFAVNVDPFVVPLDVIDDKRVNELGEYGAVLDWTVGIAYARAVSAKEFEIRWTLQINDLVEPHIAAKRAAALCR